jgi:hypothetical protein
MRGFPGGGVSGGVDFVAISFRNVAEFIMYFQEQADHIRIEMRAASLGDDAYRFLVGECFS